MKDIQAQEVVLIDRTVVSVVSDDTNRCDACSVWLSSSRTKRMLLCCRTWYCSDACEQLADVLYHKANCGKDLRRLKRELRKSASTTSRTSGI